MGTRVAEEVSVILQSRCPAARRVQLLAGLALSEILAGLWYTPGRGLIIDWWLSLSPDRPWSPRHARQPATGQDSAPNRPEAASPFRHGPPVSHTQRPRGRQQRPPPRLRQPASARV